MAFMKNGLRPVRYDTALALEQLAAADVKLGELIERVGSFRMQIKSAHSPFEALLEAILYQQLHANAARAILGRLLAMFGDIHPDPEQLLAAPEETALRIASGVQDGEGAARIVREAALASWGRPPDVIFIEGFQHPERPVIHVGDQKSGATGAPVATIASTDGLSLDQLRPELERVAAWVRALLPPR